MTCDGGLFPINAKTGEYNQIGEKIQTARVSMMRIPVTKGALQPKPAFGCIPSAEWFFMNTV